MHHFAYRDGVLHAEAVDLADARRRGRHAVLLLFDRDARRATTGCSPTPSPDVAALVCYAMKANSNQAVIATLARARRRRRRGVGGRAQARARGRHAAGQDHVLRRRQDRARARARGRRRHPLLQRRIRAGARAALGDRRRQGPHAPASRSASIPTSTPRPTPRSRPARPRTSSAFRSAAPARSMRTRRSCRASRSPASTCISAARSPTSRRSTTPSRCWPISCATLRADGHAHRACRSRRRPRHSLPRRQRAAAAAGRLCRDGQARHRAISAAR